MEESKVQSVLLSGLKSKGWFVRKISRTNCPGDPDIFSYKDGRVVWIEVKKAGRNPDPIQKYRQQEITSHGMECICIAGIDEADKYLSSI